MKIRHAVVSDARAICEMVNHYAEQGLMLHRSLESVYDALREFLVAEEDGMILGCVAVDIYWGGLAEIRSLAIAEKARGRGIGKALVRAAIEDARSLGLTQIFALTYETDFFLHLGFDVVDLTSLPEKVWRECLEWYVKGHRHETAMVMDLSNPAANGTADDADE